MSRTPFETRFVPMIAGCLACLVSFGLTPAMADDEDESSLDLVMYGVPQESQELFRYVFSSDTYTTIGVVTDRFGREVVDLKGLAYIRSGPNKGIYGASEEDPFMDYLIKIDGLTADATLYSQAMGTGKISGMVAYQSGGIWYLLTADYNNELYRIDPATGVGTYLCPLKNRYQGLAVNSKGLVFATTGSGNIWAIDVPARMGGDPSAEWQVGSHGQSGIEALEFALSMDENDAEALGIDEDWVADGLLFTYGQSKGLLVVNPETGAAVPYPSSVPSLDLEGIIFMPETRDGFGQITLPTGD